MPRSVIIVFMMFALLFSTELAAQRNVHLKIVITDSAQAISLKKGQAKLFSSKEEAIGAAQNLLLSYLKAGYLAASIDSLIVDSLHVRALFHVGDIYQNIRLRKGNLDKYLMNEVGFKEKSYRDKTFRYEEILKLSEKLIGYCEDNGYPFASFALDSVLIGDDRVEAAIHFEKHHKITVDSIVMKGNGRISRGYIYHYIGIKPGHLYDESQVERIDSRLRELAFGNEVKPSEVLFTEDKARVYIYLDKKKASRFYGVLGVLPNNRTTGKVLINGELKLSLLNAFGHGEFIDLDWRSISKGTQDLKINLAYPYLFGTPFGINYKFILFKKDTSYLTVEHNIGVQYFFSGQNYVKAFADIYSSRLLSSTGFETMTVLPDFADVRANLFGAEINIEKYNYKPNPTRGHAIYFSAAAGVKKISRNDAIQAALYDSIALKSTQVKMVFNGSVYVPMFKKTTLLLNSDNGYLINHSLFDNELFRFGGLRSLRGFDEESLRASYFSTVLVELRYLFERNSFFAVFFNGAYYEKRTQKSFVHDTPYGFGAGAAFDTKIGMFSIYYALGSEFSQAISFKQGKIHFGFTNTF